MSREGKKLVTDDDLREIYADLVDTEIPDDDELEELAALAALTDEEREADLRAIRARIDAAGKAPDATPPKPSRTVGSGAPPADVRQIVSRPRVPWLAFAAAFVMGVVGTLLVLWFGADGFMSPTPLAGPRQADFLEPVEESDVLRGSEDDGRFEYGTGRLLLCLIPPTAAELAREPPTEVGFVVLDRGTGEIEMRGSLHLSGLGGYLFEVPAGRLPPGSYEIHLFGQQEADVEDVDPLAVYEFGIEAEDRP